jgi:Flp pilus assembly protein TadD
MKRTRWIVQGLMLTAGLALVLHACNKNKEETKTAADETKPPAEEKTGAEEGAGDITSYTMGETEQKATFDEPAPDLESVGSGAQKEGQKATDEGIALLTGGNTSGAAAKFQAALEADPKACVAAYNLGVISEREGKMTQAKKYYKQAFTAKPDYGPAVAAYVMLEYKTSGSLTAALNFIEPKAKKYPEAWAIQAAYAKLLVEDNQIDKAMGVAKEVLKKDERNVEAMIALASAYHCNGQDEFAKFIINQAKDIEESNPEIYVVLADIAMAAGNKKLASTHLQKAIELNPYLVEAQNNLAVMLLDGANFEEAAKHLVAIVPVASYKGEIFLNLGEAYRGLRKWDDAMDAFAKAEKLGAPKEMIYFNLALLYFAADSVKGLGKKEILLKSQSYFIKYRDEVGAKAASDEIDIDSYLKRLDNMIRIQEKLDAKKSAKTSGE